MSILDTARFEAGLLVTEYKKSIKDIEGVLERVTNSNTQIMLDSKLAVMKKALDDLVSLKACLEATELGQDVRVGVYTTGNDQLVMCLRVRHWVTNTEVLEYILQNTTYTEDSVFVVRDIPLEDYMAFINKAK